jgi:hypothetical protein
MIASTTQDLLSSYSGWYGKSVVLLLIVNGGQIPIPCSIVGESAVDVRIRISSGLEVDLRKASILTVEEDNVVAERLVN